MKRAKILKDIVNIRGKSLNIVGTANSVAIIISCEGWINKLLSTKKSDPKPINMSLVM